MYVFYKYIIACNLKYNGFKVNIIVIGWRVKIWVWSNMPYVHYILFNEKINISKRWKYELSVDTVMLSKATETKKIFKETLLFGAKQRESRAL